MLLLDARENVGAPTSQHKKRRYQEQYIGYMDLKSEFIEIEPSYFEKVVQKLVWVDAMVEYNSIIRNSAWEVVPRPIGKLVVGSIWVYKVK